MEERKRVNISFAELVKILSLSTAETFLTNLEECLIQLKAQGKQTKNIRLEVWTYDWFKRIRTESEICFSVSELKSNYLFNECLYDAMQKNNQSYKLFCQKYGSKKIKPTNVYQITTIFISANTIRNMHIYKDVKAGKPIYLLLKKYKLRSKSSIYRIAKKYEMQYSATSDDKSNATC